MSKTDAYPGHVPIIAPKGALDLGNSRGLQSRLAELAGETTQEAILDLSGVSFIDSVGLGVVLKAASRFHRQAKRLFIVAPPGPVHRILYFAVVTDRLAVVESVDEALAGERVEQLLEARLLIGRHEVERLADRVRHPEVARRARPEAGGIRIVLERRDDRVAQLAQRRPLHLRQFFAHPRAPSFSPPA